MTSADLYAPPTGTSVHHGQPILLKRTRRSAASDVPGCELRDLVVKPRTIGLKTLVSPKTINVFQCVGQCQYPFVNVSHTAHAAVVGQVHSLSPKLTPAPCCRPSKLGGLRVILLGKDGAAKQQFVPNLVAKECACQ